MKRECCQNGRIQRVGKLDNHANPGQDTGLLLRQLPCSLLPPLAMVCQAQDAMWSTHLEGLPVVGVPPSSPECVDDEEAHPLIL